MEVVEMVIDIDYNRKTIERLDRNWAKYGVKKEIRKKFLENFKKTKDLTKKIFEPVAINIKGRRAIVMACNWGVFDCVDEIANKELKSKDLKNYHVEPDKNIAGILYFKKDKHYSKDNNGNGSISLDKLMNSVYIDDNGVNKDLVSTGSHYWEHAFTRSNLI